jgi:peptidoglycan hydrolase CwlO-like protein
VLALKDLLSSLSKTKNDVTIELQRILDQIRDRKRLLARVDGELLQLQRNMEALNLKILDLQS